MSEQEQGTQNEEQSGGAATPAAGGDAAPAAAAGAAGELEKVRGLVLQAHPDVVPELVRGQSVDELIASVEPARAAYQAVADRVRAGAATPSQAAGGGGSGVNGGANAVGASASGANPAAPPAVPAGGAANVVDPANIPASEKIRRALEAQRKR